MVLLLPAPRAHALQRYLRVAVTTDLPPYQFTDDQGNCVGMHIDMMAQIAQEMNFILEYVPCASNRACFTALESGKADVALGLVSGIADPTRFLETSALTNSQLCLIAPSESLGEGNALAISTAVFASDTVASSFLLAGLNVREFISVGDQRTVFEKQRDYPDAAMVGVKDSLIYQLTQSGQTDRYTVVRNHLDTISFSLVVPRGDAELLRTLEDAVSRFRAGYRYEEIYDQWLPRTDSWERARTVLLSVLFVIGIFLILALAYIFVNAHIKRSLQRQVAQQTETIQAVNQDLARQLQQVQDENNLRNRIIRHSPSGMVLFDQNYTITLMNRSAMAIAGVPGDRTGGSIQDLPVFREILAAEGGDLFSGAIPMESRSLRLGPSAAYTYTMHQVTSFGSLIGILLTVQDVTKAERMKQAEFEKEKNQAMARIVAGIAHEIRNPLMSIRTFAALVGSKGDDRQVQESFAYYVPLEVDRINKLVENLIHYAKPVKRSVELVGAAELAEESLSLLLPVLKKGNIRLVQSLDRDLSITADRDQIKQVLINLLMNAIEAMEERRRREECGELELQVSVDSREEQVLIRIQDQGIGMSGEDLIRCRDPFFSTKQKGTGLGLSLCEQYVKENNGELQIESVPMSHTRIDLLFGRSTSCSQES